MLDLWGTTNCYFSEMTNQFIFQLHNTHWKEKAYTKNQTESARKHNNTQQLQIKWPNRVIMWLRRTTSSWPAKCTSQFYRNKNMSPHLICIFTQHCISRDFTLRQPKNNRASSTKRLNFWQTNVMLNANFHTMVQRQFWKFTVAQ
jgi:hypothetical protein